MLGEGWWARWPEEVLLPPVLYFGSPKQDGFSDTVTCQEFVGETFARSYYWS